MAGKADQADVAEVLRLQAVLRQRHEALAGLEDADRADQLKKVFSATNNLLNFEAQVPVRRDARHRKVSSVVVYVAAGVALAAMLTEVALMLLDRISWWYIVPVVVVAVAAGAVAGAEHRAPTAGHRHRAVAAVLVMLSAALVVAVTVGLLPWFALFFLLLILIAAVISWALGTGGDEEAAQ